MCKANVKKKYILLIYANMNMEITWYGYDARLCLKLLLNKLKEMKGPTSIYTQKLSSKKLSKMFLCVHWVNFLKKNLVNWESIMN